MAEQDQQRDDAARGKGLAVLAPVERAGGNLLRRMLDLALDGTSFLPSARQAAASALSKKGEHEAAIDALVRQHVALAGAQGFLANLGGLIVTPVTLPANIAGLAMLELRMVAGIAHLRGYDLDDTRCRAAIMLSLLGPSQSEGLPTTPLLVATAPVPDAALEQEIAERVLADILTSVGGRRAATLMGRRIPLVGGGVGAAADGWMTWQVARWAQEQLVSRRRPA